MNQDDLRVARCQLRVSLKILAFGAILTAALYTLARALGWPPAAAASACGPSLFIVGVSLVDVLRAAVQLRTVARFLS